LDVGFLNENFRRLFCAPKQFPEICVSIFHPVFAIKIHKENPHRFPQRISRIWILYKQNFAQKKKENVLVEMGILGDFFKRFV
jgi:hypothetical protein